MGTNSKKDTLVTVSISTRDLLKETAIKEGRTMKGLLDIIVKEYVKDKK